MIVSLKKNELNLYVGLGFLWMTHYFILSNGLIGLGISVTVQCIMNMALALLNNSVFNRLHLYSFSVGHIFNWANIFLFSIIPAFSYYTKSYFILNLQDEIGIVKLLLLDFWILLIFTAGYIKAIKNSQLKIVTKLQESRQTNKSIKLFVVVGAGVLIGALSFIHLYQMVPMDSGLSYSAISYHLQGKGWIIRTAELMPVAGLILISVGTKNQRKLGLLLLLTFSILRFPFYNRENIVKYFVVLFLYKVIFLNEKMNRNRRLIIYATIATIALSLPFFSAIRGEDEIESITYLYYMVRDLNFSEVVSKLFSLPEFYGKMGLLDGAKQFISILLPRSIYPDKGFPIAITITSIVTTFKFYRVSDPAFGYAPSYIGFALYIGGVKLVLMLTIFIGYFSGVLVKRARLNSKGIYRNLELMVYSVIIYYFTLSQLKLDPSNALSAGIIPVFYITMSTILFKRF